jgi:hypothetical protein
VQWGLCLRSARIRFRLISTKTAVRFVVRAVGEIDLASGEMLRKSLLDGFESDASSIMLDLTGVSSSIQADYTHCMGSRTFGRERGSSLDPLWTRRRSQNDRAMRSGVCPAAECLELAYGNLSRA